MSERKIYRISYNKREDAYETYFYFGNKKNLTWDDFEHEATYPCLHAWIEHAQAPTEEKCMVHYMMLNGIHRAMEFGYKIEFKNKPEGENQ